MLRYIIAILLRRSVVLFVLSLSVFLLENGQTHAGITMENNCWLHDSIPVFSSQSTQPMFLEFIACSDYALPQSKIVKLT